MRTILKLSVAFLIIFAMIGMASAVTNFAVIDLTANGTNYDITFSWDSDISLTAATINDDTATPISEIAFSATGASFEDLQLTVGTNYAIIFSDTSTEAFKILATATPSALGLESTNSDDRDYTLAWTNVGDLEIYNGTGWDGSTVDTLVVDSSALTDPFNISYRVIDGTNISLSENLTFVAVTFSATNTPFSIEWTVAGLGLADLSTDLDPADYYIENDVTHALVGIGDISFTPTTITASSLSPSTAYTLFIRENGTNGLGLFQADTISTGVLASLFDSSGTDRYSDTVEVSPPGTLISIESGTTFNLTATTTVSCDFEWIVSNNTTHATVFTQDDGSGTTDTFSWTPSTPGDYYLTLTVDDGTNPTQSLTWIIEVTERSTGKRIWTEGMPGKQGTPNYYYTWDARSFSGFYYNLDNGEGDEKMTIYNISRTIARNDIVYVTKPSSVDYSYSSWGSYDIVGFMGDKYYAGDLMTGGNLSKVLIDESNRTMLRVGQYYALEEGYSLKVNQINLNGNIVQFILEKDGKEVNGGSGFANSGSDFVYEKRINNKDIEFIRVHVDSVFQGTESSIVQISGVFQISDQLTPLKNGEKIGKMEITNNGSGGIIEMKNSESITLSQNTTVPLMGKMNFVVADNSTLKFAPTIEYTDPGIYEIRGTVSDFSINNSGVFPYSVPKWDPNNFEGFYFDINDDTGAVEKIEITENPITLNSTRRIDIGNLIYTAEVTDVTFNYSSWGSYKVIGFMGVKYYAGTASKPLLDNGNLSKVLMDDNERRQLRVGQYLTLEDGYSLKADQINVQGSSVLFVLEKDGKVVSTYPASPTNPFVYEKDVGNVKNVEFIKISVREVFQGTESSIVMIDGVFQISDEITELKSGTKYGNMKVDSTPSLATGIKLTNEANITLSSGNTVDFMTVGNTSMSFKVGDNSSVLRFAPIAMLEIKSDTALEVELSSAAVTVGDPVTVTVKDRGVTIEGATVIANGSNVGTTNSAGVVSYTPNSVGTIRIAAEKTGYVGGNATLTVNEKLINMTITVNPEPIYQGAEGTIKVTDALNGSALSGAALTIGGTPIGQTNANGELKYNFTQPGAATIQATKAGYVNATKSVSVLQQVAFTYSNFSLNKENLAAKSTIKLSFDIENTGIENGSRDLTLVVTDSEGNVVNETTKSVSVNVGKSKSASFSFKVPLEGSYSVTLREDGVRQIDLPQNISTISAGPSKLIGSNIIYIVVGAVGLVVLAVIGVVAYLFGVKGANTSNFSDVGKEVWNDIKSKLHLSNKMK